MRSSVRSVTWSAVGWWPERRSASASSWPRLATENLAEELAEELADEPADAPAQQLTKEPPKARVRQT